MCSVVILKHFFTASTLSLSTTTHFGFSPSSSLHQPLFLGKIMNGGAVQAMVGLRVGAGAVPKGPPVSQESLPTVGIDLLAAALPHQCVVSEFHYELFLSPCRSA